MHYLLIAIYTPVKFQMFNLIFFIKLSHDPDFEMDEQKKEGKMDGWMDGNRLSW